MVKPRIFTGITATGSLTLGHYLGVIHHLLLLQEEYEVIVMIADLHALTIPQRKLDYCKQSQEIAALLYACGLKEDCKIFIQSQIKEHLELNWFLSPLVTISELNNMIQYKEKKKSAETGNLALLSYPILMASDILLYDADLVIVGQDQKQHCELTSSIARKFNNFYQKEILKLPKFTIPNLGSKIMGLKDPYKKMSKSENDYIALLDKPETIKKKIRQATTDSEAKIYFAPEKKEKAGISNLLLVYSLLKSIEPHEAEKEIEDLNYHQFKDKLIELVSAKCQIIQNNFVTYQEKIIGLLKKNQTYLQDIAQKKIKSIKHKIKIVE